MIPTARWVCFSRRSGPQEEDPKRGRGLKAALSNRDVDYRERLLRGDRRDLLQSPDSPIPDPSSLEPLGLEHAASSSPVSVRRCDAYTYKQPTLSLSFSLSPSFPLPLFLVPCPPFLRFPLFTVCVGLGWACVWLQIALLDNPTLSGRQERARKQPERIPESPRRGANGCARSLRRRADLESEDAERDNHFFYFFYLRTSLNRIRENFLFLSVYRRDSSPRPWRSEKCRKQGRQDTLIRFLRHHSVRHPFPRRSCLPLSRSPRPSPHYTTGPLQNRCKNYGPC